MMLYGMSLSPFVRKVLIFAAEKGLEIELKPVGLGAPDPEFRAISPFGKMPAFRDGDFTISDSSAIVTYLEAKHPEPALFPAAAEDRARAVWFEEFVDTILFVPGAKIFFNRIVAGLIGREGDPAIADKAAAEDMPTLYAYLESVMPVGEGWLVGDKLTIADIAVASPLVNMLHAGALPDAERFPKLHIYAARWFERASLKPLIEKEQISLSRTSRTHLAQNS